MPNVGEVVERVMPLLPTYCEVVGCGLWRLVPQRGMAF